MRECTIEFAEIQFDPQVRANHVWVEILGKNKNKQKKKEEEREQQVWVKHKTAGQQNCAQLSAVACWLRGSDRNAQSLADEI